MFPKCRFNHIDGCVAWAQWASDVLTVFGIYEGSVNLTANINVFEEATLVQWRVKKGPEKIRIVMYNPQSDWPLPPVLGRYENRTLYSDTFLWISNLSLQDTGVYILHVTNWDGHITKRIINLIVEVPAAVPRITCQMYSLPPNPVLNPLLPCTVSEGGSIFLCCSASQGTNLRFHWYKDGGPLFHTGNLSLVNLNRSNCGEYTCVVSNAVSRVETAFSFWDFSLCASENRFWKTQSNIFAPIVAFLLFLLIVIAVIVRRKMMCHNGDKSATVPADTIYEPMYPSLRRPAKGQLSPQLQDPVSVARRTDSRRTPMENRKQDKQLGSSEK
ncbi:hepatic and glial cell adhesion molecule isoform X2 [Amia ocellicauda]|uniref:hepatic and glial cell adhesion molecule isoform X2 n=1 Tax=Amia ocellicauda TaxID=2972642 RepID=UPI003464A08C